MIPSGVMETLDKYIGCALTKDIVGAFGGLALEPISDIQF